MEPNELRAAIEAILLVSNEPVKLDDLVAALDEPAESDHGAARRDSEDARRQSPRLRVGEGGGRVAAGHARRARSDPEEVLREEREHRLSIAALETLAIVAYRQPVTARSCRTSAVSTPLLCCARCWSGT